MSLRRMLLRMCRNLGRYVAYTLKVFVELICDKADASIVRRPPSRGPVQLQNIIPSHPTIALSVKGKRESVYIHRVSFYFAL
jgi:hypothetical protein